LALVACAASGAEGTADTAGENDALDAYPAGPYGTAVGDTIANLGFYDPESGETAFLSRWYQDRKTKLLMLVSTAAW
jgi:hypothetical protein